MSTNEVVLETLAEKIQRQERCIAQLQADLEQARRAAYRLKEGFYAVYEGSGSPEAALAAYEAWNKAVVPEVRDAFGDLIRAFTNWRPWILNYFEHPVTNAYTESLNSLIRVMNRLGRGYSFEALRANILFTEGAHKHKLSRPKFERRREPELAVAEEVMGYGVPDDA